jgi:hypothetical protein
MQEMELVVEFIRGYIMEEEVDLKPEELNPYYSLTDLELAMDFALISEGILKSDKVFDYANVVSVRLHTLASGENKEYFNFPHYVTRDEYIDYLTTNKENGGISFRNKTEEQEIETLNLSTLGFTSNGKTFVDLSVVNEVILSSSSLFTNLINIKD